MGEYGGGGLKRVFDEISSFDWLVDHIGLWIIVGICAVLILLNRSKPR